MSSPPPEASGGTGSGVPLEPSRAELRDMVEAVLEQLLAFVERRAIAPATDYQSVAELLEAIRTEPPEQGVPLLDILDLVMAAGEKGEDTAGPGWLAYIPGGGLVTAALADLIAGTTNRFVAVWEAAPAMAEIEATVIRWLCRLFGYGDDARGILTSGGSLASFSAIVAARHTLLEKDVLSGVLYITTETHRSIAKAARLAGFPEAAVRVVATDRRLRMDCEALREAIHHDRRIGLHPFLVVATAGTANSGAVDPIPELAAIAAEETLWLHVDAAYGGFFQLTERGRQRLAGIERADSITVDPHKGMFLPYGTGALLVRDGQRLRAALHEAHRRNDAAPDEILNFADYSVELSREARGLRLWLPIKLHGLSSFRDALDEKLDLARYAHDHLCALPDLEVPWEPELSIVAFRAADAAWPDPEGASIELFRRINASRRFVLSSARIDGHFMIRVCILSVRTHRDRVEELLQRIRTELNSLHEHESRRSAVS